MVQKNSLKKVIIITGQTATGKSDLAIRIAKKYNGEIISADSVQIYKGLDIGSAKESAKTRKEIKHHLIDYLDPLESFSVADYQKIVRNKINEFKEKNIIFRYLRNM